MKKAASGDTASSLKVAPKTIRSINEDMQDQRKMTQVERLAFVVNAPSSTILGEGDWSFAVENEAQGMSEIAGQLGMLLGEVSILEEVLRPHMPDHLYEPCDGDAEGVGNEGYYPANDRSRTPAVAALCELANTVQRLRRAVNHITTNVVV